jgi:hypothetical protein
MTSKKKHSEAFEPTLNEAPAHVMSHVVDFSASSSLSHQPTITTTSSATTTMIATTGGKPSVFFLFFFIFILYSLFILARITSATS